MGSCRGAQSHGNQRLSHHRGATPPRIEAVIGTSPWYRWFVYAHTHAPSPGAPSRGILHGAEGAPLKVVTLILALVLGGLGLVFVIGHQGMMMRLVVGSILIIAALVLAVLPRLRAKVVRREIVQKIDLSGDVSPQKLVCSTCSGQLNKKNLSVEAGAIFVACPYCNAHYQLEEAPKW